MSILDAPKLILHNQTQILNFFLLKRNYTWQGSSWFNHFQAWKKGKKVLWWKKIGTMGNHVNNTDGHVCCQHTEKCYNVIQSEQKDL